MGVGGTSSPGLGLRGSAQAGAPPGLGAHFLVEAVLAPLGSAFCTGWHVSPQPRGMREPDMGWSFI